MVSGRRRPGLRWLRCRGRAALQGTNVGNRAPTVGARELARVRRHIALTIGERMEDLPVFHLPGIIQKQRRRWRKTTHGDGTIASAGRPVALLTERREHGRAAIQHLRVVQGDRAV